MRSGLLDAETDSVAGAKNVYEAQLMNAFFNVKTKVKPVNLLADRHNSDGFSTNTAEDGGELRDGGPTVDRGMYESFQLHLLDS